MVSLRDGEVAGRRQLEELGLNASERLNSNKGRKARFVSSDDEEDFECEKCRTNLFISFVSAVCICFFDRYNVLLLRHNFKGEQIKL